MFSASSGSVIGSKYKSSITVSSVYGSALYGKYVVATIYATSSNYILIYNTELSSFSIKLYSVNTLYSCDFETSTGRLVINGKYSSTQGYLAKFMVESITSLSEVSSATWTMNTISSGTDDLSSESFTFSTSSPSATSASYSNTSVTYTLTSSSTSDIYYQTSDKTITVIENTYSTQSLDLSCSSSGSTAITFSISNYNGVTAPTWISIDSSTGDLNIKSPKVSADKSYTFYVDASISGISNPVHKLVTVKVSNIIISDMSKGLTATTQAMITTTVVITSVLSMMNSSSMASLWSMINQVQLFFKQ